MLKIKSFIFVFLLFVCVFSFAGISQANGEQVYTITHSELTQLEENLKQAKDLIKIYEMSSNEQMKDLRELKARLVKVENLLTESQSALKKATEQSKELENSLKEVNQSLKMYEKEMKKKMKIVKRQRNLSYLFLGGTAIYALSK